MAAGPDRRSGAEAAIRTTRRRGRISTTTREALDHHLPRRGLPADGWTAAGLAAAFGRDAPRLLDVGGGTGEAVVAFAAAEPGWDVVAVELHRPGLARMARWAEDHEAPNLRVVEADVVRLLDAGIEPGCFAAVRLLFPDPWPKRRHHERRLVDAGFVRAVTDVLAPGGTLHVATDWADYAAQVRTAIAAEPRLVPRPIGEGAGDGDGDGWRSARPDRPVTAYERRGRQAGRAITDLVAVRRPAG